MNRTHLATVAVATLLVAACGSDSNGGGESFGSGQPAVTDSTVSTSPATAPSAATTPGDGSASSAPPTIAETTSPTTTGRTETEGPLAEPTVALFEVGSFDQPVEVAFRPSGGELYVVEQP